LLTETIWRDLIKQTLLGQRMKEYWLPVVLLLAYRYSGRLRIEIMIVELNRQNLTNIRNKSLVEYVSRYLTIYEQYMRQVHQMGIGVEDQPLIEEAREKIEQLRRQGAQVRNSDKSIYINRISPACLACQTGIGSTTFFISLRCHRSCYYCFNSNQENYPYYCQHQRDLVSELELLAAQGKKLKYLALTGGEPLLYKPEAVQFFATGRKLFPNAYARLYTCGDYVDEEILSQLQQQGLDEIRISIRIPDLQKGHRQVFDKLALAKKYIPNVMVEMPILPGSFEIMKGVLDELDRLEIFGINLLELCYPLVNTEEFNQRSFRVKTPPYQVLYDYWYAGGLPIAYSELECLDLVQYALDQKMNLGVHYCSLENKHTGQIYQQNKKAGKPALTSFSQKDYFLKSAKVFGEDVTKVREKFRKQGFRHFSWNQEYEYLEFPVQQIKALGKLDIEIGISYQVLELRNGELYVRELKVDLTTPQVFDLVKDV
jgi:pyruvate formate-lyase activating enzyme-like uncharacterized protein